MIHTHVLGFRSRTEFVLQHNSLSIFNTCMAQSTFTTLEKRRNRLGRVTSRSRLWDCYWGQNGGQLDDVSPVTAPQATARCNLPHIASGELLDNP